MRNKLIIFFVFLLIPIIAQAEECTMEDQLRLREIAGKAKINYELGDYPPEGMRSFIVTITGFSKEIYVTGLEPVIDFRYEDEKGIIKRSGFAPGRTYKLEFYGSEESKCSDYKIFTKLLSLPHYNYYSEHPLCEGHEDYILCQKFVNSNELVINNLDFYNKMTAYIESLEKNKEKSLKPKKEEDNDIIYDILKFLDKYYFFLYVVIILGVGGIVYIEIKESRRIL
jgi:hypothetical protein